MENVLGVPWQLLDTGLTVICAVIGILLLLVAVNVLLLVLPFAAKPICVLVLVH